MLPDILQTSETTLLMLFEQRMNDAVFAEVMAAANKIDALALPGIIATVPSYASIQLVFDPLQQAGGELITRLKTLVASSSAQSASPTEHRTIEIPVCYDAEFGWDLASLAAERGLSCSELVERHCGRLYQVYAIGFLPGFAYLGSVDPLISGARKAEPRRRVAKGSVGIANQQTAVYPAESPGGWQIIGRCPLTLVDYSRLRPSPFAVGDQVQFVPIDRSQFGRLLDQPL